ncbi:unnamed protein product [Diabrotica balteata]|uniref:SCP domain-containing protein n=1 Tax=Diabrotica balteata TaxID=107213 RepID=A0A9N9T8X6_DIABA|nr:unnamed protein product [Diabrotica balteata]
MTKLNRMLYRFIVLLRIVYSVVAVDYCSLCENRSHTLCLYPNSGPGPNCLEYKKVSLSSEEKQYIVEIHNDIRNFVASGFEKQGKLGGLPPAANMMPLEWDEELATIAQRWVDQCIPLNASGQHDLCRQSSQYKYVGQNAASSLLKKDEETEFDIFILKWYQAVKNVIPSDIQKFEGFYRGRKVIGHYSQMVWANSKAIGCGAAIYKAKLGNFYHQRFICNYGPGGNVQGQPIYIRGKPCSKCPNHKCDNFRKNLCESLELSNYTSIENQTHLDFDEIENKFNDSTCIIIPGGSTSHECKEILGNGSLTKEPTVWKVSSAVTTVKRTNQTKQPDNKFISKYKRALGKWYQGECRCDIIYRSKSISLSPFLSLILVCLNIVLRSK